MKKFIYTILVLIFAVANCGAANLIFSEDFDDESLAAGTSVLDSSSGYSFVTGYNGSGKALKLSESTYASDSDGDEDARYSFSGALPNPWPTNEFYMSVWIKVDNTGSPEDCSSDGWKWFYPSFSTPGCSSGFYITWSLDRATANAIGCNGLYDYNGSAGFGDVNEMRYINDGIWAKFEYHYNIQTSYVKVWVTLYGEGRRLVFDNQFLDDGVPVTADLVPFRLSIATNSIKTHCGTTCDRDTGICGSSGVWETPYCSQDCGVPPGQSPCKFFRVVDELEIWDGPPDDVGDIYSPYIEIESIKPGIDEAGVDADADIEFRVVDAAGNLDNLLENHTRFYFIVEPQ